MAGEKRDLTNRDDSRPVRVKVDNVKKVYNTTVSYTHLTLPTICSV